MPAIRARTAAQRGLQDTLVPLSLLVQALAAMPVSEVMKKPLCGRFLDSARLTGQG